LAQENDTACPHHALVLWALFLSGFAAMVYQVCFIRIIAIGFGSTVYSFSVMVAAFIAGLTIGSAWIGRIAVRDHYRAFGIAQWGIVVAFLALLPLYKRSPYLAVQLRTLFPLTATSFFAYEAAKALAVGVSLLLPTVLMGMTFPLAAQLNARKVENTGRSVGVVYGFNTVGNLLGAILGGVLLLPALGLERSFTVALALNLAAGLLIVATVPSWPTARRAVAVAACVALVVVLYMVNTGWTVPINHAVETLRIRERISGGFDAFCKRVVKHPALFAQEDANASVVVYDDLDDRVLVINGKIQATAIGDVTYQLLEGHVPLLLRPDARDVLVVGLGGGITVGAVLQHPVTRVDVVELSPAVARAARESFGDANHHCLDDPRVRLHVEDGAAFVKTSRSEYDVILNTLSHPWIAGVGNLFAVEYFRDCAQRLRPGGVMLLWFHLYEMDNETARMIVRTFGRVFPHIQTWFAHNDVLVIGSQNPVGGDLRRIEERFADPKVARDLERGTIATLPMLLCHQLFDEEGSRRLMGDGPVHLQHRPRIEFQAAQSFFVNAVATLLSDEFERTYRGDQLPPLLTEYAREHPLTREDYEMMALHIAREARSDDSILWFYRSKVGGARL
jgi:spermidine synthase